MDKLYNAAGLSGIPPAGVAQVSGDSVPAAPSGYDRQMACRTDSAGAPATSRSDGRRISMASGRHPFLREQPFEN
ncbi:hypothetical protein [Pseudarthrobacter sulfonivorans]|uniref:hypothetical protein n=1 Tax=Pseudarthrobacter sulfonivorans TaxID=121292 RepID=UPI0028675C0A|nr:hypothetical protein [Pseudarthrobacter sulfonivorans]MDR6417173.1 hypothetical protein [Pseudarthrobacter sulfonivorans]